MTKNKINILLIGIFFLVILFTITTTSTLGSIPLSQNVFADLDEIQYCNSVLHKCHFQGIINDISEVKDIYLSYLYISERNDPPFRGCEDLDDRC